MDKYDVTISFVHMFHKEHICIEKITNMYL